MGTLAGFLEVADISDTAANAAEASPAAAKEEELETEACRDCVPGDDEVDIVGVGGLDRRPSVADVLDVRLEVLVLLCKLDTDSLARESPVVVVT